MPTLSQGRLWVLSSSLILSCAAFGISISFLRVPIKSDLYISAGSTNDWRQHWQRDPMTAPPPFNKETFHIVMILGTVSSALNMLLSATLLIATIMKRKTIISTVAVEAICSYVASFLWLATGIYAEHRVEAGVYFPWLDVPECIRYKVLEGISYINWIQLMLYANTLMTVATICHLRGHRMWLHPASALPTFASPALSFAPKWEMEYNSSSMTQTNESQLPILGVSNQPVDSRNSSHFRSRLPFFPNQSSPPGIPPAVPSPRPSDSVASLARSRSAQSDVTPLQNAENPPRPSSCHQSVPIGEPPTYSGPGSIDESFAV